MVKEGEDTTAKVEAGVTNTDKAPTDKGEEETTNTVREVTRGQGNKGATRGQGSRKRRDPQRMEFIDRHPWATLILSPRAKETAKGVGAQGTKRWIARTQSTDIGQGQGNRQRKGNRKPSSAWRVTLTQ